MMVSNQFWNKERITNNVIHVDLTKKKVHSYVDIAISLVSLVQHENHKFWVWIKS